MLVCCDDVTECVRVMGRISSHFVPTVSPGHGIENRRNLRTILELSGKFVGLLPPP